MPVLIALLLIIVLVALFVSVGVPLIGLLWLAVIGLIVGALARLLVPGDQAMGWLSTALFGIAGALIGGLIAEAAGIGNILQFVISVITAAVLVALFIGRGSDTRVLD